MFIDENHVDDWIFFVYSTDINQIHESIMSEISHQLLGIDIFAPYKIYNEDQIIFQGILQFEVSIEDQIMLLSQNSLKFEVSDEEKMFSQAVFNYKQERK